MLSVNHEQVLEKQSTLQGLLIYNRQQRGWSLRQSAKELGFSPAFVSRLENGKEFPSLDFISAIARQYKDQDLIEAALIVRLSSLPVSPPALQEAAEILARSILTANQ